MSTPSIPCRILVVDDALEVRQTLRWALDEIEGILTVGEAGDGIEAIEQAQRLKPDLLILDVVLPKLDGYEVARRLKAQFPTLFIIFLTVHNDLNARKQATAAGGDAFVSKSAGWFPLYKEIDTWMQTRRPTDSQKT